MNPSITSSDVGVGNYLPTEGQHDQTLDMKVCVAVDILVQHVLYKGLFSVDQALARHVVVVVAIAPNQLGPMHDDGSSQ